MNFFLPGKELDFIPGLSPEQVDQLDTCGVDSLTEFLDRFGRHPEVWAAFLGCDLDDMETHLEWADELLGQA